MDDNWLFCIIGMTCLIGITCVIGTASVILSKLGCIPSLRQILNISLKNLSITGLAYLITTVLMSKIFLIFLVFSSFINQLRLF